MDYGGTLMNMDDSDWVDGVNGNALDFDGVDDYVEISGYKGVTGTAIFKCTSAPPIAEEPEVFPSTPFLPTGNAQFAPYDPSDALLPSDHYLWLVGEAAKMLTGELTPTPTMPTR